MSFDVVEVASVILRFVSDNDQGSASGTRISAAIRGAFPNFSPAAANSRSLREFIKSFVPQLEESPERAGLDVIYRVKQPTILQESASTPVVQPQRHSGFVSLLLNDPRAWKTFASPQSTSKIFVKTDGSEVLVSSMQSTPVGGDWVQVNPLSADLLLSIAKEFVELVPELYRQALIESLAKPKWWIPYFEVMGSLGLKSRWVTYRRRRILDEFSKAVTSAIYRKTLQSASVPEVSAQEKLLSRPQFREPSAMAGVTGKPPESAPREQIMRRLAMLAVQRMSVEELRSLVISVGSVIDVLDQL